MTEPEAIRHAHRELQTDDGWHRPPLVLTMVGLVALILSVALIGLPREGVKLPDIAVQANHIALPKWGTTEAVSEVVYRSRGFDTFGETFLLLAAVVAVVTLSRSREPRSEYVGEASAGRAEQAKNDPHAVTDEKEATAREAEQREEEESTPAPDNPDLEPLGSHAPERSAAMTVIVRIVARTAAVPLAVAGVYLAAWGYTPGGGFPSGAVLTGVAILLYAALGHRAVVALVRPSVLEPVEMAFALVILGIGLLGLIRVGSLWANWVHLAEIETIRAGGTSQMFSLAEIVEVFTGLTIAIFALLGMKHDWAPDASEDEDES